jgi:hypothetical protein
MLKGEAKKIYQRNFMRRKRAGLPPVESKPKPEWRPSQRIIDEIQHWRWLREHQSWRLGARGEKIIDGLALDTDESWNEACRRYKADRDAARARSKAMRTQTAAAPVKREVRCTFCNEMRSPERRMVTDGFSAICEQCARNAIALMVA